MILSTLGKPTAEDMNFLSDENAKQYLKDNPQLTPIDKSIPLAKVIVDSRARLPLNARLFESGHDVIVATTAKASDQQIVRLQQQGAAVIVCPERRGYVDLRYLFKELAQLEMASILIEGGGCVVGSALRDELVDEMNIYISPQICGDVQAVPSIQGLMPKTINQTIKLDIKAYHFLEPELLIEASVQIKK